MVLGDQVMLEEDCGLFEIVDCDPAVWVVGSHHLVGELWRQGNSPGNRRSLGSEENSAEPYAAGVGGPNHSRFVRNDFS
jgi:hypothetical protein